jgi:hypothetical protein
MFHRNLKHAHFDERVASAVRTKTAPRTCRGQDRTVYCMQVHFAVLFVRVIEQ